MKNYKYISKIFLKFIKDLKQIKYLIFYGLFLFNISCDCWTDGNGVVVDSITKQPLDSVIAKSYVEEVNANSFYYEMITDSTGQFEGTTGNTGNCKDLVIELSKIGYIDVTITNPIDDTIKMSKH